jgi:class 3 adenylate cyclase/tetratricopeptide (TPR) repeat protein
MKCPKCQFDNRNGVKFCEKCGVKMELVCPNCGAKIPLDRQFCGECGQNLAVPPKETPKVLTPEEKIDKIQKYLPKGIAEKILAQKDRIEGERKQVTVMFCDMEGFTPFADRFGPEETYAVMDRVYEILIHKVHDYEGTVNEFTGDGIMALFGAPIALEDAPQRGIRSAYAIHREMNLFSNKLKQAKEKIPPIKMRIGIHTGPVVVGTLGNDLRVEFKAVGDTVNLASRMEGLAEPGTTYVTEDTYKLTEGFFRFESLGEYAVKGKTKIVKAYRVIEPSTRRTRFDVSAERGLTPFVGKEREIELLVDGFDRSKMGRGQAFSIMAEAGFGKSRLLYEFRKAVANEDVAFLEGKCLSYSRRVTYHPIIEIMKANFDIMEGDGDYEIGEKLKQGLNILDTDEASTLPFLLELLSVKDSGIDKITISPEAKKDRTIEALKKISLKGSEIRPLIMVFEDLHWIDKSSEDVLKYLLEDIAGARVFLIFTYRPEFVHTWGAKSYHSQVNLNRLSNRESLLMVSHLLDGAEIHGDFEDFILAKTEGVPFFIEEFIRSLKDLKIIERKGNQYLFAKDYLEMTIPSTIQDVIMARVDALPEGAKEVIQAGSVIEREFSYELIRRVMNISQDKLLSHLSVLKDSELIYERGIYPDTTYVFKHTLTCEVVYNSILTRRKKKLHEDIGNAIDELYKENIDEYFGVLAEHFICSENYEKGADYSKLAEKKSKKAASLNDAVAYAKKRISCLEKLSMDNVVEKKIIDARTVLGLYYNQMTLPVEAKATVDPIVDLAIKRNYKRRVSQISIVLGSYYYIVNEDYPKALEYYEKALKIGEELDDILSLGLANIWKGVCLSEFCEFEKALSCFEKALEINVMANVSWGISMSKSQIAFWVYLRQGKTELAYQTTQEALRIADESVDIFSKGVANFAHGIFCDLKGFFKEAEEHLLMAIDFCQKSNQLAYTGVANLFLGDTYLHIGEYKTCQEYHEKSISLLQHGNLYPSYIIRNKISIVLAKVMNKEKDIHLNEIFKWHEEIKLKLCEVSMQNCIGSILLNIDDHHIPKAEEWIKKSIKTNQQYGMMWNLAQGYALYSEFYKRKGDLSKAKEMLSTAIETFHECGADGWVERYEKELAALS